MRRTAPALLTCALPLLWLAGCGGGGGTPPGPGTQSIMIPVEDDALVTASLLFPWDATGITLTSISLGDDTQNNTYRGLMRFPLAAIPAGANVVGARLHIQFLERLGSPGDSISDGPGGLGDMQFHRLAGGPLALADFGAAALAHDSASDLTVDTPNQTREVGALTVLQSAMAASESHLKVRVEYQVATNNDRILDQMRMGTRNSGNGAVLEVVIQP